MLVQNVFFLSIFNDDFPSLVYLFKFFTRGQIFCSENFLWFNKINISFRRSGILLLHAQNTSSSRGGSVTKLPLGTHCGKCGNLSRFFYLFIFIWWMVWISKAVVPVFRRWYLDPTWLLTASSACTPCVWTHCSCVSVSTLVIQWFTSNTDHSSVFV